MAVKTKKKAVAKKKQVKKKASAVGRKKATSKKIRKGSKYSCEVCGIGVTVDEVCGCVDVCDIICCGEQMKPRKK